MHDATSHQDPTWLTAGACSLDDFRAVVEVETELADYPHAAAIEHRLVVYEAAALRDATTTPVGRAVAQAELARALLSGPGVLVIKGAFAPAVLDRVSTAFEEIIAEQKRTGAVAGDHYAKPGANDRIWNAIEKLAVLDPEGFVDYYANDLAELAIEAFLGPAYQLCSQVNVVNPGADAQEPHRDYHIGFFSDDQSERYLSHVHHMSPLLTLQGAIAHCDMPIETGPTKLLPRSQNYGPGFLAWRRPDFREYFAEHHVQAPLGKGDIVFFNPALFHAAGANITADVRRMANLLQVMSAFGRSMEIVDRQRMVSHLYPVLLQRQEAGVDVAALHRVVASSAEGYAFPADLDIEQPVDGLAPPSMADVVRSALAERWAPAKLDEVLAARRAG